jgi:hypothetical protein
MSSELHGRYLHYQPSVLGYMLEAQDHFPSEFVVTSNKASPVTPALIKPTISIDETTLLVQRGIEIEDKYATAFPEQQHYHLRGFPRCHTRHLLAR